MNYPYENIPTINKEVEKERSMNKLMDYEQKVNPDVLKAIAGFISLAGAIVGIIMGFTQAEYHDEFNVGIMFLVWLISDIVAVFLYTSVSILDQLMKIKTYLGELNHAIFSTTPQEIKAFDPETEWQCEKCGRINSNYTGTCACGQQREENEK